MHQTSYRRLQQYALAISVASIIYNGAEGGVSIGLGADAESRSLIFFGIQSGIEVISAILVVWRFRSIAKPGEERSRKLDEKELRIEKIASTSIAFLLILLGLATEATSIFGLVKHSEPSSSTVSLAVAASALVIMIVIWLPKRYLARALNSSAMQAEAQCSLSCIQITIVLFVGALIFKVWRGGWWVDSATSIVLGLSFAWEGIKLLKWVRDPNFDGGCCGHCANDTVRGDKVELGLEERYRDLCECCNEKEECRLSDECKCSSETGSQKSKACCVPVNGEGGKCCTHDYIPKPVKPDSCCGGAPTDTGKPSACASHAQRVETTGGCCGAGKTSCKEEPKSSSGGCCSSDKGQSCLIDCSDSPSDPVQEVPAALTSDKSRGASLEEEEEGCQDSCCGGDAESVAASPVGTNAEPSSKAPATAGPSNQGPEKGCSCCH
ncbi:hypothetical protein K435DRAFT_737667 [Dendrothele bispora CBS 962.96]|uniref:Cation efflux protein transmembrane domain-containing protein n=1 Tax=Dendrothele bispora (strain CBS 962.96) TaxID=1314807 RepID=A0A4S8KRG3_DENBC|nr:hypothetical protein K435DRAFT_737667 [Dendrothele bispora CBS 962.96]